MTEPSPWMPNSGNTPNNVSALSSTYPAASSPLILVEGGIPGQEGLRILPAAPALGLESGAVDYEGGVAGDGRVCAHSVYVQKAAAIMTALGYSEAAVWSSQLSCQLTAILSLLQTAPLFSLRDEAFRDPCHSQDGGWGGGG